MKISDILTKEEIKKVRAACKIFKAQWVEIDGVKYTPPESK